MGGVLVILPLLGLQFRGGLVIFGLAAVELRVKRFGLGSAGDAYLLVADRRGATYCAPMEESK